MLASTIGPRPVGSSGNARARHYLIGQLTSAGFVVRVQQQRLSGGGISYPLANVIAFRHGAVREAIALVAHYDTMPDGPGAADDALGVAICLEAARVLSSGGLRHSLAVILTDGEEVGLLGARAAVTDQEVQERVRGFLNFDAAGGAGPPLLFQVSPGLQTALRNWPAGLTRPQGGSFLSEILRHLPAGSDFSVFSAIAPGLNFGSIADAYVQHTGRDTPERVSPATLRTGVVTAIAGGRALDAFDNDGSTDSATYFDLAGWRTVVRSARTTSTAVWAACALALVAWLALTREGWHEWRFAGLANTAAWSVARAGVSLGGMALAGSVLGSIRREASPWYASPGPFLVFLAAVGCSGLWLVSQLAASAPQHLRPWRSPRATWWTTLPLWTAAAIWLQIQAPLAVYLVAIPLLITVTLLVLTRRARAGLDRVAAGVVAIVAAGLWLQDGVRLLLFLVPFSATAGIRLSVPALVQAMCLPAVMLVPPILAALPSESASRRARTAIGWALAALSLTSGIVALVEPGYTKDRPLRRQVRYIQDDVQSRAWLEVGSTEPAMDVLGPGHTTEGWEASAAMSGLTQSWSPFMFQTVVRRSTAKIPFDIQTCIETDSGGHRVLDVVVTPHEYGAIALLPIPGLTPIESSLAGEEHDQPWRTVAAAMKSLHMRGALDDTSPPRPEDLILIFESIGLPPGENLDAPDLGLLSDRGAWRARSVFIVRAWSGPHRPARAYDALDQRRGPCRHSSKT